MIAYPPVFLMVTHQQVILYWERDKTGRPFIPISIYYALKMLAQAIRSEESIHGIFFDNAQIKEILYTDDLTSFVRNSESINILDKLDLQDYLV